MTVTWKYGFMSLPLKQVHRVVLIYFWCRSLVEWVYCVLLFVCLLFGLGCFVRFGLVFCWFGVGWLVGVLFKKYKPCQQYNFCWLCIGCIFYLRGLVSGLVQISTMVSDLKWRSYVKSACIAKKVFWKAGTTSVDMLLFLLLLSCHCPAFGAAISWYHQYASQSKSPVIQDEDYFFHCFELELNMKSNKIIQIIFFS